MTNDTDFDHDNANFTVDSDEAINKSKYETLDQQTDGTITFTGY